MGIAVSLAPMDLHIQGSLDTYPCQRVLSTSARHHSHSRGDFRHFHIVYRDNLAASYPQDKLRLRQDLVDDDGLVSDRETFALL
jgi:hypothetical protein